MCITTAYRTIFFTVFICIDISRSITFKLDIHKLTKVEIVIIYAPNFNNWDY